MCVSSERNKQSFLRSCLSAGLVTIWWLQLLRSLVSQPQVQVAQLAIAHACSLRNFLESSELNITAARRAGRVCRMWQLHHAQVHNIRLPWVFTTIVSGD